MALFVENTLWDELAPEPDPTPYQQLCQQLAQDRLLQQQVARHGDAEMRKAVSVPVANADMPTEGFVRSYELKLPGQKSQKKKPPDPCAMAKASSTNVSGSK